jgi:surfeit locus 1 family protein
MSTATPEARSREIALQYNLGLALLVVLCVPLLLALGFWQLWRAEEKAQALAIYEERRARPPLALNAVMADAPVDHDRIQVQLHGRYMQGRDFLLDNRIKGGKVGYELISPLQDDSGQVVLVNRGWLAAQRTRDQLPSIPAFIETIQLSGEIHAPRDLRRTPFYGGTGWPQVVQTLDVAEMGALAGVEPYPHVVRLRPGQASALEIDWQPVNMQPERHHAYAAQWFLMAAALLIIFMVGGTNTVQWVRHRFTGRRSR